MQVALVQLASASVLGDVKKLLDACAKRVEGLNDLGASRPASLFREPDPSTNLKVIGTHYGQVTQEVQLTVAGGMN